MKSSLSRTDSFGAYDEAIHTGCRADCRRLRRALKLAKTNHPSFCRATRSRLRTVGARWYTRVRTLYYGGGGGQRTDKNRAVFKDSVPSRPNRRWQQSLRTSRPGGKDSTKYWGFGFNKMPVNGRVWYRTASVRSDRAHRHGNHNMKDFSDPG